MRALNMSNNRPVIGRPSKAFFVDMITRDLTVDDSILDLIDNSVDAAVTRQSVNVMNVLTERLNESGSFQHATVDIEIDGENDRFVIRDSCGGISIDEARETVFRFGNPRERAALGGLSVYGIGMKRSFFKLGRKISVRSETQTESFDIDIDVDEWTNKGDEDWDFRFSNVARLNEAPHAPGTTITISQLTEAARRRCRLPGFAGILREKIGSAYALFLAAGLEIKVDGIPATSILPANLTAGDQIQPARQQFKYRGVDVLIIAGVSPRDDRRRHGWYVFCNGRMVLDADKTEVTGWVGGRGLPKWHTKFGHFVGYLYFRSDDVHKLPWRTTKQGVVSDSAVYQRALAEMQVQARPVLAFLSKLYPGEIEADEIPEREGMRKGTAVSITKLPQDDATFKFTPPQPRPDRSEKLISIQYKKKRGEIEHLKACIDSLNSASARKVGEYAFDYLKMQECPE